MAYKYKELEKQSVLLIEKHKLFFIEDIIAYLPCVKSTFYDLRLHESDDIKEALTKVKTEIKVSLRSKWYKSQNPILQMGLMKLLSNDEELQKLSQTYHDPKGNEKDLKIVVSYGNPNEQGDNNNS